MKKLFGLIGHPLSHSFSKKYFSDKFIRESVQDRYAYENFDLPSLEEFPQLINSHSLLSGLNVTIPYKEAIIPYLDELDVDAFDVEAVNTIVITRNLDGEILSTKGYNTDITGFQNTLGPLLKPNHTGALVLGTGGASKAVTHVLKNTGIPFLLVSRNKSPGQQNLFHHKTKNIIGYGDITRDLVKNYPIIINTTPLGTFPDIDQCPPLPYEYIDDSNLLYDLVYNPANTLFLQQGASKGAVTVNGYAMLELQAEAAWKIWTSGEIRS